MTGLHVIASGGSSGHLEQLGPCGSMALRHEYGPSPQVSPWPSIVTGASNTNTDLDYSRATDPDTAIGYSSGPDVTMALGSSAGHSDLYGISCIMSPRL